MHVHRNLFPATQQNACMKSHPLINEQGREGPCTRGWLWGPGRVIDQRLPQQLRQNGPHPDHHSNGWLPPAHDKAMLSVLNPSRCMPSFWQYRGACASQVLVTIMAQWPHVVSIAGSMTQLSTNEDDKAQLNPAFPLGI